MNLPSNRIGVLFLILVLLVVGTISFSIIDKRGDGLIDKSGEEKSSENILTLRRSTEASSIDTDGDGLLDWEEALRGSNPTNPDTDGDGTLDGEEVLLGRDPSVAGPNDTVEAIKQKKIEELGVLYEDFVAGSLTDNVAIDLFSNYFQFRNEPDFTDETQTKLITQIASVAEEATKIGNKYSTGDTRTFIGDEERIRNYGNSFAEKHLNFLKSLDALETGDSTKYLDNMVALYKRFANDVILIETPQALVEQQVQIANNFYIVGISLRDLNEARLDPVKGLFAIKSYNEAANSQPDLYLTIAKFFRDNDIIFDSSESGSFWTNL